MHKLISSVTLIYERLSNYKPHTFSNAGYLAGDKPVVFQIEDRRNSEDRKRLEAVGIWTQAVRMKKRQTFTSKIL